MTSCLGFMGGMETTNHNPNLNHRTNPNPMINNTNTNTTITTTNRRYRGGGSYREGGGMEQGLKCPRCESANTKFCYFNNYSRKQPRHFCKNCRRYWTKGGALRNVPVGGGCRKNNAKHPQNHRPRIAGVADPTASTMSAAAAHMESIMNHHPTTHENNSLYTSHMGLLYPNVKREEAQASISMPMYNTNPNTNNNNNNNNNNEILIFPHPAAPMVPSSSLDEQYMMSKPLLLPQHQLHYLPQFQTPGEPFHDHDALELSLRRVASSSSSCKTIMKSPTSLGEQFGVVVDDPNLWMLGGPIPGWPMDFHATIAQ